MPALLSKLVLPANRLQALWQVFKRHGHARVMTITAQRTTLNRWKDHTHFYWFLAFLIWGGAAITVNTLYGPCQLQDTPDDYEPHSWEYERHPMFQLVSKYCHQSPSKFYELHLAVNENHMKKTIWEREEARARHLMYERQDYKAWHYVPYSTKWIEWSNTEFEIWKRKLPAFMKNPGP